MKLKGAALQPASEVSRDQGVSSHLATAINAAGSSKNLVAILVKNLQSSGFVSRWGRADSIEHALFHREADFESSIVTPKTHAVMLGVIASGRIWKVECHGINPSFENELGL